MKALIPCGGVGSRFWPVSRSSAPKQFANTLGDKSYLQATVERLLAFLNPEDIFITTGAQYKDVLALQIPQIPTQNIILEPQMKDTGMAVAYATKQIFKKYPDEVFGMFWIDHIVKKPDIFKFGFDEACRQVKKLNKMIYFEVPIRFPDVNLGHIEVGQEIGNFHNDEIKLFEFKRFLEKPNIEKAEEYFKNNDKYFWNTGYLISTPRLLLSKFEKYAPDLYNLLELPIEEAYDKAPKQSFDYILAEKLTGEDVAVLVADIGWYDIGEWVMVKEALEKSKEDNVTLSGAGEFVDSENCLTLTTANKLVSVIGMEGVGIIDTEDALLVLNLKDSNKVKQMVNKLKEKGLEKYT